MMKIGGRALVNGIVLTGERFEVRAVRDGGSGEICVTTKEVSSRDFRIMRRALGIPIVRGILILGKETWGGLKEYWKELIVFTFFMDLVEKVLGFLVGGGVASVFSVLLLLGGVFGVRALFRGGVSEKVLFLREKGFLKKVYSVLKYHGAEHKVIGFYGATGEGCDDTQEVRSYSRISASCGSHFVVIYLLVSMVLGLVIGGVNSVLVQVVGALFAVGVSYEVFLLSKERFPVLAAGGAFVQEWFVTVEPGVEEIEVGVAALNALLENENHHSLRS